MKKYLYQFSSIIVAIVFLALAIGSGNNSNSPEDKKEKALNDVRFSGRTANIIYEIEDGTWLAQHLHEEIILEKVYHIFMDDKADKINITIYDYCEGVYGHNKKRTWHKTINKKWHWWSDAYKYADAEAYCSSIGQYYPLSDTDEGKFRCCGRDRTCN